MSTAVVCSSSCSASAAAADAPIFDCAHLEVDVAAIRDALARVMPEPRLIAVSGKTGEGIGEWLAWLEAQR